MKRASYQQIKQLASVKVGYPDIIKFLREQYEHERDVLVNVGAEKFGIQQGRCQAFKEVFDLFNTAPDVADVMSDKK